MKSTNTAIPLEKLFEQLPENYTVTDRELVQRAYRVAEEAHREQKRHSGEPYITHCIAVASILSELKVPPEVIAAARARARTLLSRFGLAERLDHLPSELSAGQRQRIAIARALSPNPKVVVADEPTVALDGPTAKEVMVLLREYVSAGTAVVLVTHDLRIITATDRVVEMEDGHVVRDGRGLSGNAHTRERIPSDGDEA